MPTGGAGVQRVDNAGMVFEQTVGGSRDDSFGRLTPTGQPQQPFDMLSRVLANNDKI